MRAPSDFVDVEHDSVESDDYLDDESYGDYDDELEGELYEPTGDTSSQINSEDEDEVDEGDDDKEY